MKQRNMIAYNMQKIKRNSKHSLIDCDSLLHEEDLKEFLDNEDEFYYNYKEDTDND